MKEVERKTKHNKHIVRIKREQTSLIRDRAFATEVVTVEQPQRGEKYAVEGETAKEKDATHLVMTRQFRCVRA